MKETYVFLDKSGVGAPALDVAHLVRTPHLDTQSVPDLVRLLTHHARVLEGGKFIQKRPRRRSQLLKITGLMGRLTFGDPLLDSGAWQVLMNRVETCHLAKTPIRPEAGPPDSESHTAPMQVLMNRVEMAKMLWQRGRFPALTSVTAFAIMRAMVSIYQSIFLSIYLSIYLYSSVSIHLSMYLSIFLSICIHNFYSSI